MVPPLAIVIGLFVLSPVVWVVHRRQEPNMNYGYPVGLAGVLFLVAYDGGLFFSDEQFRSGRSRRGLWRFAVRIRASAGKIRSQNVLILPAVIT